MPIDIHERTIVHNCHTQYNTDQLWFILTVNITAQTQSTGVERIISTGHYCSASIITSTILYHLISEHLITQMKILRYQFHGMHKCVILHTW